MKICLLAEAKPSPVLTSMLGRLARRHTVLARDPQTLAGGFDRRPGELADVDLYLLKSRSPVAQAYAQAARRAGSIVLNTPEATSAALDRVTMATLLSQAGVPVPRTWTADSLGQLAATVRRTALHPTPGWPLVIKSRYSRRGDLVTLVSGIQDLLALLPAWAAEPVLVQEYVPNDGFDLKFWVIDGQVTVARRPAAIEQRRTDQDVPLDPAELPPDWITSVLDAGAALGLEIFGVDAVLTDVGPTIIDVNAFPGFRSSAGADAALTELVERRVAEGSLPA